MSGRSKLTPQVQDAVCRALRDAGADYDTAARYAGIDPRTHYRWMDQGEAATSGKYRDYFVAVTMARTECTIRNLRLIQEAAFGIPKKKTRTYTNKQGNEGSEVTEWKEPAKPNLSAQWWLERFGGPAYRPPRESLDLNIENYESLTDEQLAAIVAGQRPPIK